ncbi:MAG: hypothetical protein HRU20_13840 [Pseudomonadales bacterium]|nr:hypothetical protein [Pseudomonadales bacterium]
MIKPNNILLFQPFAKNLACKNCATDKLKAIIAIQNSPQGRFRLARKSCEIQLLTIFSQVTLNKTQQQLVFQYWLRFMIYQQLRWGTDHMNFMHALTTIKNLAAAMQQENSVNVYAVWDDLYAGLKAIHLGEKDIQASLKWLPKPPIEKQVMKSYTPAFFSTDQYYVHLKHIGHLFAYLIKMNLFIYQKSSERIEYTYLLNHDYQSLDDYQKFEYTRNSKVLYQKVIKLTQR